MTTQTRTGGYLKRMANGGHFKQKLGETALALTECFCKADDGNRARLGDTLISEVYEILVDVYGWDTTSAKKARDSMTRAFQRTGESK